MSEPKAVCVFGPPSSGVSSLLQVLADSSETNVVIVEPGDVKVLDAVERAWRDGAKHVLVDGVPRSAAAVQDLVDSRLVWPGNGAIIRVAAPRPFGPATEGGWRLFNEELPNIEKRIRLLSAPYFTVQNTKGDDGLAAAVAELARRAGIRK